MATESNKNNLRNLLDSVAKERGYGDGTIDVQDVSSEGANYTSTLHLVTISATEKEDLKLFAKVASINESLRATDQTITKVYDTERIFYSELVVAFEQLYNKHEVNMEDRIIFSKYYGHQSSKNREILLLENLTANGYGSFDRFKPFDWDYASAAVKVLGKFHALGIAAKEENLKELEKIREIGMDMSSLTTKNVLVQHAYKIGTEMVKQEYRSRFLKLINERDMLDIFDILWKPSVDGFLIHSDYRPNNLMHRRKNGRVEVVPLDFQTLHFGTLVADLLYFVWLGSDSKFRENHYQQLLELYYDELTIALANLHVNINEVYPRKTFEQELEDSKTLGLVIGLAFMSILTVDPENAPQFDSHEDFAVKPNQIALDKINEIVGDYVKWGII